MERQEQLAQNERREYRKQMERFRQIEQRVEAMQNGISRQDPHGGRLLKKKMKAVKSQEHRFEREKEDMTQAPDMEKAIFVKITPETRIPNGKIVLDYTQETLSAGGRVLASHISLRIAGPEKYVL